MHKPSIYIRCIHTDIISCLPQPVQVYNDVYSHGLRVMPLHPPTFILHVILYVIDSNRSLTTVHGSDGKLCAVSISNDVVYQDTLRESTSRRATH